jgi:hypothetical protein
VALVLATRDEVRRGVDAGYLAAFEIARENSLAVLAEVGAGIQLHVVLLNLFIDGLFALLV